MSLVKFTELPSGSIQGGDVLAVAGASSYKVTATELANFANARVQGGTTSTVAYVETKAIANKVTLDNTVIPQLGQVSTNKADIAKLKLDRDADTIYTKSIRDGMDGLLAAQYDNVPSMIASIIKDDNFIKNPAAQHISNYWKQETRVAATTIMLGDLRARNLEYPGWSRDSNGLITYNFTVALIGLLTLGQIGGTNPTDLEYRVNGGTWNRVGRDGTISIGIGYAGLSSPGAKVSIRVKENCGGIMFAIPTPAYWLTKAGIRDAGVMVTLEKLTLGLHRKRIDLVACGYWFANLINKWNDSYPIPKPVQLGDIATETIWEFDGTHAPTPATVPWDNDVRKRVVLARDGSRDYKYLFAASDPDLYDKAEVFI